MLNLRAKDYRLKAFNLTRDYRGLLALVTLIIIFVEGVIGSFSSVGSLFTTIDAEGNVTTSYISYVFSLITLAGEILLYPFFVMGTINICSKLSKGEPIAFVDMFSGFKKETWIYVGANVLSAIFICLWSLLFIIPGIIKTYSYSMVQYICKDNPNIDASEAITKSRQMMDGNKWKLFCLDFSYIGWLLLSVLTCGILMLWVYPRMLQAHYEFYCNISGKYDVVEAESETTVEA